MSASPAMLGEDWEAGRPIPVRVRSSTPATLKNAWVVQRDGCWRWRRGTNGRNGILRRGGRTVLAHVYVYEQHRGPVPVGLELDHTCREPL